MEQDVDSAAMQTGSKDAPNEKASKGKPKVVVTRGRKSSKHLICEMLSWMKTIYHSYCHS
jgi:hypothetical protein